MKRIVWPLLVSVSLFGVSAGQNKSYPNRWVRISSNLREDGEVDRIRKIVETAAQHGLTGVALSAGLYQLDLKTPDYFKRLQRGREICAERKIEIIPSFMSAGYRGSVLAHDKNLAAGLPVRGPLFVAGRCRAKVRV